MRISDWSSDVCSSDLIVEVAVVPLAEEVAGHAPAGLLVSLDTDEAAEARAGGYLLLCEEAADRVRRNAVLLVPDPLPDRELALLAVGQIEGRPRPEVTLLGPVGCPQPGGELADITARAGALITENQPGRGRETGQTR